MQYRKEKGLLDIPLSTSLTYVAQTHVKDRTCLAARGPRSDIAVVRHVRQLEIQLALN